MYCLHSNDRFSNNYFDVLSCWLLSGVLSKVIDLLCNTTALTKLTNWHSCCVHFHVHWSCLRRSYASQCARQPGLIILCLSLYFPLCHWPFCANKRAWDQDTLLYNCATSTHFKRVIVHVVHYRHQISNSSSISVSILKTLLSLKLTYLACKIINC